MFVLISATIALPLCSSDCSVATFDVRLDGASKEAVLLVVIVGVKGLLEYQRRKTSTSRQ